MRFPHSVWMSAKLGRPNKFDHPFFCVGVTSRAHGPSVAPVNDRLRFLSQLAPGETGLIVRVQAEPQLALRMLEMGLVCGAAVRFLRTAPWGDPIEVDVEGLLLSLRRSEADAVMVEMDGDAANPR